MWMKITKVKKNYFKTTSQWCGLLLLLPMQNTICEIKLGMDWRISWLLLFYFRDFDFSGLILNG